MTVQRKQVDTYATLVMTSLCIVWGIQQVAIKGVADEISPALQVAIRSGAAAGLIYLLIILKKTSLENFANCLIPGGAVGILFGFQFLFVAEGLRYTSASHMSVFLYTAPIFAALGLQFFRPDERLCAPQWIGIAIAFAGICVAFLSGKAPDDNSSKTLAGDIMGLFAGLSWGATTVLVRCSSLSGAPASLTLFYQLTGGFLLLSAYSYFSDQNHFEPGAVGIASLIFQSAIVGFLSYLAWYSLMHKYMASQLGILSFMTPVFGVITAVFFLSEQLQSGFISGSILILSGISVVSGWPWFRLRFLTGSVNK
ncbi:DMT family transporter [Klebsiella quasipneumoniae]|uniref:DMT family transporter n=1 Tax=Klebsiella quasipneumoniae TaxID=1463165 RepID=UPI000A325AAF|nr:DMT family transporter [Klebsiella quasipneumoniae]HCI5982930.1 DMT family transporter [Klebsiella quasipneumoniae subsp. quasipneumoniae]MDM8039625.1 DMT family transporter [Klebsiella quasipneumoniae]PLF12009.1 EamA family transporter [Klebsiella quasipneumoniae]HCI6021074.1 DMT family transporter [Klebsiella quasipneumoniae subsp. quasipneumoniae]HCI6412567.1 DMT family transporter [Klebsiella quasipneumoniae subsp. quasipneumoniae]